MKTTVLGLATFLLVSLFFVNATTSISSRDYGVYDPWYDLDDDGDIDIYDVVMMTARYGTTGEPYAAKAALEYDSGWIDMTNKAGEYFNITHSLNSTEIFVDITGKTIESGGVHQKQLGGTGFSLGWNRTFGGPDMDGAFSFIQAIDGGYMIAGRTRSFGAGEWDCWLIKTDALGMMQWNKTYGDVESDYATSMVQTPDGEYVIAGVLDGDFWLFKTDALGNVEWDRTYGGVGMQVAQSVVQTGDGGYAIAGQKGSNFWLAKTDSVGNMEWNQTYGGSLFERAYSIVQAVDGGYLMAGGVDNGMFGAPGDVWLIKTDADGNAQWNQTFGGIDDDRAYSVIQSIDGGYVIAGGTKSFGAGEWDCWLIKTNVNGIMVWNKTYGWQNSDYARCVVQTSDGGYAIAGHAHFNDIEGDFALFRTDAFGNIQWTKKYGAFGDDYAYCVVQTSDGGYAIAGNLCGDNICLVKTDPSGNAQTTFQYGVAWTDSTANTITLYRGTADVYWNYVRVRIWKTKETP